MKARQSLVLMMIAGLVALLILACAPGATPGPTASPSSGVSFAGKTVTIVVPTSPGGGSDTMSRLYSRHLGRFLPGNPTIVVRNMPGGDQTIAPNYVYTAKPDGLTLLFSTGTSSMAYALKMPSCKYDFSQMDGIMAASSGGVFYIKPGIVAKAEDLPNAKGIIAGFSQTAGWPFIIATKLWDLHPDKIILAYSSGGDARRAFLSGEVNIAHDGTDGYIPNVQPLEQKGEVQALFNTGVIDGKGDIVRDPALPDMPTFKEVYQNATGKAPSGIAWDSYVGLNAAARTYQNLLLTPPGTPRDIANTYWAAAQAMIKDAEFHKDADALAGTGVPWMAGEDLSKLFKVKMTFEPKVIDWLKTTLKEYGVVF